MIEVPVSQEIISRATKKAHQMGKLNNSIRNGDGNLVGFIGEYVVSDYLNCAIENTYDYDLVHLGVRIDVKTKQCTSPPRPFYECSVAAFNTQQKCKAYIFVRVKNQTAWILGWLPKDRYFKTARFLKKGEIDDSNGFTVKADCYNVRIDQLYSIEKIKCLK